MRTKKLALAAMLILLAVFTAGGCAGRDDEKDVTNGAETHESAKDEDESDKNDGQTGASDDGGEDEKDGEGVLEDAEDKLESALDQAETDVSRGLHEAEE